MAAYEERAAINRSLFIIQDHLAELDARLARLEPWLRAGSLVRTGLSPVWRRFCGFRSSSRHSSCIGARPASASRTRVFAANGRSSIPRGASLYARSIFPRSRGHLRRTFGFFPPAVYRIEPRQRLALARRPRVLHAIANVWVGGSTQIIVDLHNHLGHRFEMKVVTSALPAHGSHKGMSIDVVPRPNCPHLVRSIFSRFRPHIVHVHYWGDVDEPWYKTIFEIAAEFGCPILQNVNTPVAPFAGVRVDRNVFVSQSVL